MEEVSTHLWIDPKRKLVAVIMSQMYYIQPGGYTRDDEFRGAVYKQLFKEEKEK